MGANGQLFEIQSPEPKQEPQQPIVIVLPTSKNGETQKLILPQNLINNSNSGQQVIYVINNQNSNSSSKNTPSSSFGESSSGSNSNVNVIDLAATRAGIRTSQIEVKEEDSLVKADVQGHHAYPSPFSQVNSSFINTEITSTRFLSKKDLTNASSATSVSLDLTSASVTKESTLILDPFRAPIVIADSRERIIYGQVLFQSSPISNFNQDSHTMSHKRKAVQMSVLRTQLCSIRWANSSLKNPRQTRRNNDGRGKE